MFVTQTKKILEARQKSILSNLDEYNSKRKAEKQERQKAKD